MVAILGKINGVFKPLISPINEPNRSDKSTSSALANIN